MVLLNIGTTTFTLYIGGIENTEKYGMVYPWWYRNVRETIVMMMRAIQIGGDTLFTKCTHGRRINRI